MRDAEVLARAIIASAAGDLTDEEAFAAYQETRDRLTLPLLRAADVIGAYRWTDAEIPALLMKSSSSMAAEIEAISAFDAVGLPAA